MPDENCVQVVYTTAAASRNESRAGAMNAAPCVSRAAIGPEIKSARNWGGRRPGAGRKPKPPVAIVPDLPRWCVFCAHGQAEISTARELARIGYDTYLPLIAIRRRDPVVSSMWHAVRVPMFPGYGFIRLTQRETREPILAVRGVRDVLRRMDGKLATLPDADVDRLRAGDEGRLNLPREVMPILKVGARMRVADGPFTSFEAVVVECDGVTTTVMVEIFGRSSKVVMHRAALEAMARATHRRSVTR